MVDLLLIIRTKNEYQPTNQPFNPEAILKGSSRLPKMIIRDRKRAPSQYLLGTPGGSLIALYELQSYRAKRARRSLGAHSTTTRLKFSYSTTRTLFEEKLLPLRRSIRRRVNL